MNNINNQTPALPQENSQVPAKPLNQAASVIENMELALASDQNNVVLQVAQVSKEYKLYDSPRARLKALITGRAYHRSHWALKEVSFTLHRGQCLGLVGDNGAGKSSLLKLMAGTLQPSSGTIERVGRVTAILELGAGFHPDFSGRDNLYFGGSLIGISQAQMAQLEAEIIEFSELGEAIDRPVKTYSSGMVVRLAFALVTAVEPEVLIIDEALAVGDQHFQKKCVERISAFRRNGCTILFCSHSLYHIRRLCNVALWLDAGEVKAFGEVESVLAAYQTHVRKRDIQPEEVPAAPELAQNLLASAALPSELPAEDTAQATAPKEAASLPTGTLARIMSMQVANLDNSTDPPLLKSRDLVVDVTAQVQTSERPNFGLMLELLHGTGITSFASHEEGFIPTRVSADGVWQVTISFPELPLHTGEYVLTAFLFDEQGFVVYDEWLRHLVFKFESPGFMPGIVRLPHHWA